MTQEFDNRDQKNLRKEKFASKKSEYFDSDSFEEKKIQRKKAKGLKSKLNQIREEELWEDWENELY